MFGRIIGRRNFFFAARPFLERWCSCFTIFFDLCKIFLGWSPDHSLVRSPFPTFGFQFPDAGSLKCPYLSLVLLVARKVNHWYLYCTGGWIPVFGSLPRTARKSAVVSMYQPWRSGGRRHSSHLKLSTFLFSWLTLRSIIRHAPVVCFFIVKYIFLDEPSWGFVADSSDGSIGLKHFPSWSWHDSSCCIVALMRYIMRIFRMFCQLDIDGPAGLVIETRFQEFGSVLLHRFIVL